MFPVPQQGIATTIGGVLAVLAPTLGPTVGGYITQQLGRFPEAGETLEILGYEARVTSTDGRRVGQIHFRKLDLPANVAERTGSEHK